jgi:hypothetical protein
VAGDVSSIRADGWIWGLGSCKTIGQHLDTAGILGLVTGGVPAGLLTVVASLRAVARRRLSSEPAIACERIAGARLPWNTGANPGRSRHCDLSLTFAC